MRSEDPDSQATGAGPGSHCLGRGVAKARDVKPVLRQACGPGLRRNGGVASLQGQGLQEEGVAGAEEELEGGSSRHGLGGGRGLDWRSPPCRWCASGTACLRRLGCCW